MDLEKVQKEDFEMQKEESIIPHEDNHASSEHHLRSTDLFKLSLRVFRLRPMRSFLTILGISIGIGTVLFLVSLGYGLQFILLGKLAATEESLVSLEAFYPSESELNISYDDVSSIIAISEVEEVSPVSEFTGEAKTDDISGFLIIKIIKPNYFRLSGDSPEIGETFTEGESAIVISNTALKLLGLEENESTLGKNISVSIFYPDTENGAEIKVVDVGQALPIKGIIMDEFQPPFIFIPEDTVPRKPPFFSRVFAKANDIEFVEPLRDKLIEKGYLISARIDLVSQARKIMAAITVVLGIFGVTALVVSAIGMFNTMIIGFLERIFEVGIMKSIGATTNDIRNLFLMESLIMGVSGGVGGILIGVLAGEAFNLALNFLASRLGGEAINLFIYPWKFLFFILAVSALVGIFSGFWPARRAAKLSAKQAFLRK